MNTVTRGTRAYDQVAMHEAAHGVFAVLLGVPVVEAVVGPLAGPKRLGHVRFGAVEPAADKAAARGQVELVAAVLLAGQAADRWQGCARPFNGPDRKHSRRLLKSLAGGRKPNDGELGRMVRDLAGMFKDDHWLADAVKAVAVELAGAVGGELSGARIVEVVRRACGPFYEAVQRDTRSKAASIIRAWVAGVESDHQRVKAALQGGDMTRLKAALRRILSK